MATEFKCNCQYCNGQISFPVEKAGQTIQCPHCQLETRLFIPPVPSPPKLKNKNSALIFIIGFILIVVFIGAAALLGIVKQRLTPLQKHFDPLHEVQGALGWKLGDVLPNSLEVKTNDDAFGITYDFNPSEEMENANFVWSYLILTENRQIAAISLEYNPNESFNKDNFEKILREKYGLRQSLKPGFGGVVACYFGQTNRQVILTTSSQDSLIGLEYRDEQLYKLATQQTERRKAANDQRIQDSLKGKL